MRRRFGIGLSRLLSFMCAVLLGASAAAAGSGAPSSATWQAGFHAPGADGPVLAVASYGGELIAGGDFHAIGPTQIDRIASYDGTEWSPIGGADGPVRALFVHGGRLIAAGSFTRIGNIAANRIAAWDGTSWSALGDGLDGSGRALAEYHGELVVGGGFRHAGAISARLGVARWNGAAWDSLALPQGWEDQGSSAEAVGFAHRGDRLVTMFRDLAQNTWLLYWDGSRWRGYADRHLSMFVSAIGSMGDSLLAGGVLYGTAPDGSWVWRNCVALRSGAEWVPLGGDLPDRPVAIANYDSTLLVSLPFWESSRAIHLLDGTTWRAIGTDAANPPFAFAEHGGRLIAGGWATLSSPESALSAWDGSEWQGLVPTSGNGLAGFRSMAGFGDTLFVAGGYGQIAGWDGFRWNRSPLSFGSLTAGADALFGWKGLWDVGEIWRRDREGTARPIQGNVALWALLAQEDRLVASADGIWIPPDSRPSIAVWRRGRWFGLGEAFRGSASALEIYNGETIAGGAFEAGPPGDPGIRNIARWDGNAWRPLGAGLEDPVQRLAVFQGGLIAASGLTDAQGKGAHHLDRWDGHAWTRIAEANGPVVWSAVYHGALYVSGGFTVIAGVSAAHVARFDGLRWEPLGAGADGPVTGLAVWRDRLYVGGDFDQAGGAPSFHFGSYGESVPPVEALDSALEDSTVVLSWRNPADPDFAAAVIRVSTAQFPLDPKDGEPMAGGEEGRFPGLPGAPGSARQPHAALGGTLYVSSFATFADGRCSEPIRLRVLLADRVPPALQVSLARVPGRPDSISYELSASEALDPDAMRIRYGRLASVPHALDLEDTRWSGVLGPAPGDTSGTVSIEVADPGGNRVSATARFSVTPYDRPRGSRITSPDGRITVTVPPYALSTGTMLTLLPGGDLGPAADLAAPAAIVYRYEEADLAGTSPDRLFLSVSSGNLAEPAESLACLVDPVARTVSAQSRRLGRIRLEKAGAPVSRMDDARFLSAVRLGANPSSGPIRFRFEIRHPQRVRADVTDVTGRRVRVLLDEEVDWGGHELTWSGRGSDGRQAPSGVYYIRIEGERGKAVLPIVRTR